MMVMVIVIPVSGHDSDGDIIPVSGHDGDGDSYFSLWSW